MKHWVFQKQEQRISALSQALVSHEEHGSQLRITPDQGSRYILAPVGNVPHADFDGGYLQFYLMIENTGRRNSTVNGYQVEIVELQQTFSKSTASGGAQRHPGQALPARPAACQRSEHNGEYQN